MIQITRNKDLAARSVFVLIAIVTLMVLFGCSDKSDNIPTTAQSVEGLIVEGWTAYQNGDYEAAVANFEATLQRNVSPELSIDAYRGLGWTYSRLEKYAQAITNFSFVISLESVSSSRFPVVAKEGVEAYAVPDTQYVDVNGELQLMTDEYIVSIDDIDSYSARVVQKMGASPAFELDPGTRVINLPKSELSNATSTALGNALDNSLSFNPATFTTAVASENELTELDQYYIDTQTGVLSIVPRVETLKEIEAIFTYHEKGYLIDRYTNRFIVLNEELEDLSDAPEDQPGDIYYIKGDFYNKYDANNPQSGGTYMQADAYAGMSAAYLAQGDYVSALEASRALMYINQDLKALDSGKYPYQRNLFDGDTDYNMWDFYKVMAICYYNINDYLSAEECLEVYLGQGDVVDNTRTDFSFNLISLINGLSDTPPADWSPKDIF